MPRRERFANAAMINATSAKLLKYSEVRPSGSAGDCLTKIHRRPLKFLYMLPSADRSDRTAMKHFPFFRQALVASIFPAAAFVMMPSETHAQAYPCGILDLASKSSA